MKIAKLRVGNGVDSEVEIGPMIHERQLRIVEEQVDDAVGHGARLLTGGKRLTELGPNFYAPTLLADVNHRDAPHARKRPSGRCCRSRPSTATTTPSDWPTTATSVWRPASGLRNRRRGEAMATTIKAGTVMINDMISCFGIAEAPHGGFKQSGIGRTHGEMGLEEMVQVKYVDVDRLPGMAKVWWFGYGKQYQQQMGGFVDLLFATNWGTKLKGAWRSAGLFRRGNRV